MGVNGQITEVNQLKTYLILRWVTITFCLFFIGRNIGQIFQMAASPRGSLKSEDRNTMGSSKYPVLTVLTEPEVSVLSKWGKNKTVQLSSILEPVFILKTHVTPRMGVSVDCLIRPFFFEKCFKLCVGSRNAQISKVPCHRGRGRGRRRCLIHQIDQMPIIKQKWSFYKQRGIQYFMIQCNTV